MLEHLQPLREILEMFNMCLVHELYRRHYHAGRGSIEYSDSSVREFIKLKVYEIHHGVYFDNSFYQLYEISIARLALSIEMDVFLLMRSVIPFILLPLTTWICSVPELDV